VETVIVLYFLLAALAAPIIFVRLRRANSREQMLAQRNANLEKTLADQRAKSEELFDALKAEQQGPKDVTLPSEEREARWRKRMEEDLTKISRTLETLVESMETRPPTFVTDALPQEQNWLANLPLQPAARLTVLEERKSAIKKRRQELQQRSRELRRVLRDCNREISYARRAFPEPDDAPWEREDEEQVSPREPPKEGEVPGPIPAPPGLLEQAATESDFARILPEDFEREMLRLILRENGRPDSESIRLVLGNRWPHVVQDKINEQAQDILGDVLLYEEGDRLVIAEEFVDHLKSFLNDRAVPTRHV